MSDISERCQQVFARVMEVDASTVTHESSPDNIENWDSLSHVQLILELEKDFSISIAPDEGIDYENFGMVVASIQGKLS